MSNEASAVAQTSTAEGAEPIVKTGSDMHVSPEDWDQLESLTSVPKSKKAEKKQEKEVETEEEKTDGEPAKKVEKSLDTKHEEKDTKDGQEKKEKVDTKVETKKDPTQVRTLKVKSADKEIEIPFDLKIPVKIDGKEELVSFEDMRNEFSGKQAWSRKYNELEKEKKTFYHERDRLTNGLNRIHKTLADGDPQGAVFLMAEAMGAKPLEVWNDLVGKINKAMGVEVDPDALKAQQKDWELNYLKRKDETAKASGDRQRELSETQSQVEAVQKTHDIDNKTFVQAYDELVEEAKRQNYDVEGITPGMVAEYVVATRISDGVKSLLETEFSDRENRAEIAQAIRKVWGKFPNKKPDEIRAIALEAFPAPDKKSSLSKKVVKKAEDKSKTKEVDTWDDL